MKKIAIDIRMLNSGGIGTYIIHTIPELIKANPDVQFSLLGDKTQAIVKKWTEEFKNVDVISTSAPIYSVREQIELLLKIPIDTDYVFSPHFNIPIFWASKTITTIHDCYHLEFFKSFSFFEKIYLRLIFKIIKNFCAGILTVSEFSQIQISKFLNINKDKIKVTLLGVDNCSTVVNYEKEDYFLFVGNLKPHKNIRTIVEALNIVKDKIPHKLIVVGTSEQHLTPDKNLPKYTTLLGERIYFTGFISNDELAKLYRNATALVFPSLYEGFGLPALEAKSFGCPTILSDISVFHEVNGDSSVYFAPEDSYSLADQMIELAGDSLLQEHLIEKGLELVKKYSWKKTTSEICQYFSLIDEKNKTISEQTTESPKLSRGHRNVLELTYRADTGGGPQHVLDILRINRSAKNLRLYTCSPKGRFEDLYREMSFGHLRIHRGWYILFDLARVLIFCKENNISIIHSHGRGAGLYSRLLGFFGFKVVHTLHGVHTARGLKGVVKLKLDKMLSFATDLSLLVSQDEFKMAVDYEVIDSHKSRVIYNGVDNSKFEDVYNFNLKLKKRNKIAVVARLDYQKGLDLLLSFVKNFQNDLRLLGVHISVAGDGVYLEHFREEVTGMKCDDIIEFTGEITNIPKFFEGKFSILSFSRWEGFPLSILEGMSCGLTPILSDAPGHQCFKKFPNLIHFHQGGFELVEAIGKSISSYTVAELRCLAVEQFSIERQVKELEMTYISL